MLLHHLEMDVNEVPDELLLHHFKMDVNEVPDELLLQIFYNLPLHSLVDVSHLTLTCKKWRRILWSKQFLQRIGSFEHQSRFLIYRSSLDNNLEQNILDRFSESDPDSAIRYITINGNLSAVKQDIKNCPLVNMTISMWCRTLDHLSLHDSTIILIWHFHLGYVGFYRDERDGHCALVKCTYTQQHNLTTSIPIELDKWYAPLSSIWYASHCGPNKWHGSLFDVCLWKRCLEPYEIQKIAQTRTSIENINLIPHFEL
jgi:hypothetical protein